MKSILKNKPENFNSAVSVSSCYLETDGSLLMLKGSKNHLWGVPAGKLEKNEDPLDGARRELFEEIGWRYSGHMPFIGTLYVSLKEYDFTFHMYSVPIDRKVEIILSDEHLEFRWVPFPEIEKLPLIKGALEAFRFYQETFVNLPRP
jgi:8-oxo-dGTP pyrophosphatase MutT (NUDIX family)